MVFYSHDTTNKTYDVLHTLAQSILDAGLSVIVDATFLEKSKREKFQELAAKRNVPFTILHANPPIDTIRQWLSARITDKNNPSEADIAIFDQQLNSIEPLLKEEQAHTFVVDTQKTLPALKEPLP